MKNFLIALFTLFSISACSQQTVDFEKVTGGATMTLNGSLIAFNAPIVTYSNTSIAFAFRINDVVYQFKTGVDHITINGVLMTSQTPAQIVTLLQTTVFNIGGNSGPTISSDSNFKKGFPFNNYSFAYGTSITFGIYAENYYTILQRQLGNSVFANYAVSSTSGRTACFKLASFQGSKLQGASIGDPAFNMSRWGFATASLDSAHLFPQIRAAYRWLTAFQFTDTLQFYRIAAGTVNPNVTTSQSALTALVLDTLKDLGSRSLFFGTNSWWKQSIVANETYQNTSVKGKTLIIGVWACAGGGSRIQYDIDGVTAGTYDPNNRCVTADIDNGGFRRTGIINDVIIVYTGKDSLHTVKLTFLDGGTYGGVDFIGNLREPSVASWAPIYIPDIQHMNATGYALTSGSSVVQDSATNSRNSDLAINFSPYIASGAIQFVHINISNGGHFDPNDAAQINADGIHPMGPGYRNYVIDIMNSINPKATVQNAQSPPGVNQVLFNTGVGGIGSNSNFTFDGIHLTIGNLGVATDDIGVRHDQTGFTAIRSWNGTPSGQAGVQVVNDGLQSFGIRIGGSALASYGDYKANTGIFYSIASVGSTWMQDNNTYIAIAVGAQAPANTLMKFFGPSGNIQTGTNPTDVSSLIFGVSSTTKGFAPPRMTSAQVTAISSPVAGLMVYCTDCTAVDASTGVIEVYNRSAFKKAW